MLREEFLVLFDGERSGNGYETIHIEVGRVRMEHYHVRLGKRRTTVTMDTIVSEYLALRLRVEPSGVEAHSAMRGWLQERLDVLMQD